MIALFDIDGTLTTGSHCGSRSLEQTFFEAFGVERALDGISVHGNVDWVIVRQAAEACGRWPAERDEQRALVRRLLARYVAVFEANVGALPYRTLPGAAESVLAARGACEVVGLATGNVERCAHGKLRSAGLGALFDGCIGGFGDEAETRAGVVRLAIERARAAGGTGDALVIGDTPADVWAAREAGAAVVCVATGKYGADELASAGPDAVFADLRELVARAPWR